MRKTYDAILILGTSIYKDDFSDRVKKGVTLYEKNIASKIILSGRYWGGLLKKPHTTEAKEMAQYTRHLGVPPKDIFLEEESLNTIGNFYFVKKKVLEPNYMNSMVILSKKEQLSKVRFLAKKILGPQYFFTIQTTGTRNKDTQSKHFSTNSIKHFFKDVVDGDDVAVKNILFSHPYYRRCKALRKIK